MNTICNLGIPYWNYCVIYLPEIDVQVDNNLMTRSICVTNESR